MKRWAQWVLLLIALMMGQASGQGSLHPSGNPPFSQQELEQMLAPIALYPDPLLAHMLMAATYPLEIVEAADWSCTHASLMGDAAVQAVTDEHWDASVKSLVAFPQVLQTMDEKIDWTERLGDAFLAQQTQVMDTVQSLRGKARRAGNLQSSAQVRVGQEGSDITVEPGNSRVIYMPYYDPNVVYGPWWWPHYPPVCWPPWYGYYWNGGIAWGAGLAVGTDFFFGRWDWPHRRLYQSKADSRHDGAGNRLWEHAPEHRRGVPYRNAMLDRQFGGTAHRNPNAFQQYRGREALPVADAYPGHDTKGQDASVEEKGGVFEDAGHGSDARENSVRGETSMGGWHGSSPTGGGGQGH